jgi:hypothetical protein
MALAHLEIHNSQVPAQRRSPRAHYLPRLGGVMNLDAAEFLQAICAQLVADGTSSRELIAIEFDPNGDKLEVLTGKKAHVARLPIWPQFWRPSGETCARDHIGARQLRRGAATSCWEGI